MSTEEREKRIKDLIAQMTLEEKVSQLLHTSPAIPKLGIHEYNWWNECLHGVARAGLATVFPQAIALAATFDDDLVKDIATAISDEARAKYNEAIKQGNRGQYWGLTFWTPTINIFRDPRWGRGQESYGEDPFLTGRIGAAMVRGLQGENPEESLKLAACAKHYAVHSGPEKERHTFNAVVSKKDLFETYLPAFKALVDAKVESVMGAYNRALGEPCCGSEYLLKEILRDEWGFEGHVVSDCWAVRDFHENHKVTSSPEESAALALNNGCDLNCGCTYPFLTLARKKGLVTEEAIDVALSRLLRTRFKLGMFDEPEKSPYHSLGREVINCDKHRKLAREAARKSIVLLKNDNDLLPLDDTPKRIFVMGPGAANMHALMGNYYGLSARMVTVLEGLTEKTRTKYGIGMAYSQACLQYEPNHPSSVEFGFANPPDMFIAVFGLDGAMEGEEGDAIASSSNGDREYVELPPWQLAFLRKVKANGKPVILVLTGGSAISIPEDVADAVLFAWYPGEEGGSAVADVIFGDAVPSGKLPVTFPASTDQLPPYESYDMKGRTYRYMTETPLYPFGFGLSYTAFRFDAPVLDRETISAGEEIALKAGVTNAGARDAEAVVQVYVSKDDRQENDPAFSLRAFKRVAVAKGASAAAEFTLPASAFETVDADGKSALVPGVYTVHVADAAPLPVAAEKGATKPVTAKVTVK